MVEFVPRETFYDKTRTTTPTQIVKKQNKAI